MGRIYTEFEITITLLGPFLTKSSSPGGYGVDAVIARNHEGKPCIAGTHVTGKLREAWVDLYGINGFQPNIGDMFGHKSEAEAREDEGKSFTKDAYSPKRKRLILTDFLLEDGDAAIDKYLYRISIDERTGAAMEGAYQVIESPFAPGGNYGFKGYARFFAENENHQNNVKKYIEKGLGFITQLGGNRTIGFGRLSAVEVRRTNGKNRSGGSSPRVASGSFGIVIEPKEPFCLGSNNRTGNIFESEDVISGGALKGAVAALWRELAGGNGGQKISGDFDPNRKELGDNFSSVRFTHAFPAKGCGGRPVSPPMSLVDVDGKFFDVARCGGPGLISGKVPAFFMDWKGDTRARRDERFSWPRPRRELRVRTAMDYDLRRSKKEQLFSYETVIPDGYVWTAHVDLSRVADAARDQVELQLLSILDQGVIFIGKSKALAEVRIAESASSKGSSGPDFPPVNITLGNDNDLGWIVTLQSPAIMLDPEVLSETTGMVELETAYQNAFDDISDHSLCLVRYFARQRMAGGRYLAGRFIGGAKYRPFILTEAGSVFVLRPAKGKEKDARKKIEEWYKSGLPIPQSGKPYTWENCPFVPENGFGEIAVNLPCHHDLEPQDYSLIKG